MQDLIQNITSQLGINDNQAVGGVGAFLDVAKSKLDGGDFSQIAGVFGGEGVVGDLISKVPSGSSGGGLSSMLGGVTSALGVDLGSLGNLAKLVDVFKALDIDPALISKFTPIVTSWLTDKGGSGIGEILKKFV